MKAKIRDFNPNESIPCLIQGKPSCYQIECDLIYSTKQPISIEDNEFNTLVEIKPNQWICCNSIDLEFVGL